MVCALTGVGADASEPKSLDWRLRYRVWSPDVSSTPDDRFLIDFEAIKKTILQQRVAEISRYFNIVI
jgi:hypothetical protein